MSGAGCDAWFLFVILLPGPHVQVLGNHGHCQLIRMLHLPTRHCHHIVLGAFEEPHLVLATEIIFYKEFPDMADRTVILWEY